MNAESKVPSVETCRKLWDAGLRLETERVWVHRLPFGHFERIWGVFPAADNVDGDEEYPAPDLAELLLLGVHSASELPLDEITLESLAKRLLIDLSMNEVSLTEVNERTKGQP